MGYAERLNPNSTWNKKRSMNISSDFASPISNVSKVNKVQTPVKQDEPMVIQITSRGIFSAFKDFLCRMLRLFSLRRQNHAPTS